MSSVVLKPPIKRLLRPLQQGWQWWTGQLLTLCPSALQQLLQGRSPQVCLRLSPQQSAVLSSAEGPVISTIDPASSRLPAPLRPGSSPLILVPDTLVLQVPLRLPRAATDHLDTVIKHQLPLLTPFEAAQVYLRYQQRFEGEAVVVTVELVPRQLIDPQLAQLRQLGLEVTTLRPASRAQQSDYNLLPEKTGRSGMQRLNRLLMVGNLLLATLLIAFPLWQQQQQIQQLQAEVSEARHSARNVLAIREQLDSLNRTRLQLNSLSEQPAAHLTLLAQLTGTLPLDSWLSHFDWQGDRLQLRGEAQNASALIALLDQLPGTADVRFSTPITRNSRNGRERFSIELSLPGTEEQP